MIFKNYTLLLLCFVTLLLSCSSNKNQDIYGKYKMFSDNPDVSRFIAFEDNYIQVNKDNTIIYNSTINTKPKFNFKGDYAYDKTSNTLQVKWSDGNLPDKLQIELKDGDHIIKIRETTYKKMKDKE